MSVTSIQQKLIAHLAGTGEPLRRYEGGFWGCQSGETGGYPPVRPHFGTLTIRSLWKQGILVTVPYTDPEIEQVEPWDIPMHLAAETEPTDAR